MAARPSRRYVALVAVVAGQRLVELVISRRNERRAGEVVGTAGRRSFPFMVAIHVGLFALPQLERRLRPRRLRPAIVLPALGALVLATALRLWVIRSLGRAWNVRGRVAADLQVVDGGPYRFIRHPNYLAVSLEMAALPLAGGAPLSAAALSVANALVLVPRVRAEEALLDRIPGYRERMGAKPRFLPRVRRRGGWRRSPHR